MNSLLYDVEFEDGLVRQYQANTIARNMYEQVDQDGYSLTRLDAILDYVKGPKALEKGDDLVNTPSGRKRKRKSTIGWKLLVQFGDKFQQWIPLKIIKETNPVDVAEFAVSRRIDDEPAFSYWVPYTLRKRDVIVASLSHRLRKTTHKYGIQVPNNIADAIKIDSDNKDTYWQDAIQKEMSNVIVAFEILDKHEGIPEGWKQTSGHLVFDVKMNFVRKARWVKDGHKTRDPEWSTYAGVVSRESVRIAFTYAALNNIGVMAADIQNTYLQAPASEKHYVICGQEFGLENVNKVALIRRALYGGKSSGSDFWKHLRSCMEHLKFKSCESDPEVWRRKSVTDDGLEYWEYILLYVDDALCISHRAEYILKGELGKYFVLKPESIGVPKIYLGNKVSNVVLENGANAWSLSSSQYVKAAVNNVELKLKKNGSSLPKRASAPFPSDCRPELDVSEILGPDEISYYQSLIGILRWCVELGRIDIGTEASIMASHMAMPRRGHLDILYHMFAYLKGKYNIELVLDPSKPDIDVEEQFPREDWSNTPYSTIPDELPENIPELLGIKMILIAYVDADHAGDLATRKSRTGFIIYLNNSPIYWLSKKQTSIETSSYGSEFTALRQCCEYLKGLKYKLQMMGIICELPNFIFGDNKSVLVNSTVPHSTLKKKSCSISYHYIREGVAKDEWRIAYIRSEDNRADILSKPLPGGVKRTKLAGMILHHIS